MDKRTFAIEMIEQEFNLDYNRLLCIRDVFQQELQKTLREEVSSLENRPYYLPKPSGHETGLAVTLDLGGTHVRAYLIALQGHGIAKWIRSVKRLLRGTDDQGPGLCEQSSAEQLFDLQVKTLAKLKPDFPSDPVPLGYVFSFPVIQTSLNHAVLLRWAKEIHTSGVEGHDVVGLLQEALVRNNLAKQIIPRLVMNDTIGTFMASAYSYPETIIGSVIGTGYNTCYLQPGLEGEPGTGQIINLECGNFDKVPTTYYDEILSQQSRSPGSQKLEKMVSGHYLGELLRLMIIDAIIPNAGETPPELDRLSTRHTLDSSDIAVIIQDQSLDLSAIQQWGLEKLSVKLSADECRIIKRLAILVVKRSASLIAATYAAILNQVDPSGTKKHIIAINGSLYEKMPGYKEWLAEKLNQLLPRTLLNRVSIQFFAEGPALGAAVAVCMLAHSDSSE